MKTDRLLGIVSLLARRGRMTAAELAERFEVSTRTINRDIDAIARAGLPIVTRQGAGGGISLMEGSAPEVMRLGERELSMLLAGLGSLESVSAARGASELKARLGGERGGEAKVSVDLASFYRDDHARKLALFENAIDERLRVRFRYCYERGDEEKTVEPYSVVFRWADWYLFGYCPAREDFRLYKLRRLYDAVLTDERFERREVPPEKLNFGSNITNDYPFTAVYELSEKFRLVEECGPNSFEVLEDGRLETHWAFSREEDAVRWLLAFGDKVTVLDPPELVERIRMTVRSLREKYGV